MLTKIRNAKNQDLTFIVKLYNQYILHSCATFRYSPVTLQDRKKWLKKKKEKGFAVLVAESKGILQGFASLGEFRFAEGYRYSLEHSIYVAKEHSRKKVATFLMQDLIEKAKKLGAHSLIAGIDDANQTSHLFHQSLGFKKCGTLPEVGRKFDKWLNLTFYTLLLK